MFGLVPCWGSITVYLTSYLRQFDDTLTMTKTYFAYPLTITCAAIFMQIGTYLIDKVHPKLIMFTSLFTMALAVFLVSYVKSFALFLVVYSGMVGFGYGFAYMLPIKNSWLFYPNNKGFVSGIILLCYSLGAILWM